MSNTVDNRVVEMQFKNEDFERGVKQTITSLDGLKKALEINTNSLDLSRVQREADKLNLERVTSSIEALTYRFSNLGIFVMATINQAKNIAVDFKRFIRQYEVEPYEAACIVNQVLKENSVIKTSQECIGVDLFDEYERNKEDKR